jgi:hypothetical protein
MDHFHVQRKINKKNHNTIQGHTKNSIHGAEDNTKHGETTFTNRQIQQEWRLPNEKLIPIKYKEQTGRGTKNIYVQAIRINNSNSGYSNHILNKRHKYGTITNTVDIVRTHTKGKHLNTLEKYQIYKINKYNLQMNNTNIRHT